MPELLSSIVGRLRTFVGNRRNAPRYPARLPLRVSILDASPGAAPSRPSPALEGHTHDLGATGLAIVVPTVRLGGEYLTHQDRTLLITLELPARVVQIKSISVRYALLDRSDDDRGHLIGVRISGMSDDDRALYLAYLKTLGGQG